MCGVLCVPGGVWLDSGGLYTGALGRARCNSACSAVPVSHRPDNMVHRQMFWQVPPDVDLAYLRRSSSPVCCVGRSTCRLLSLTAAVCQTGEAWVGYKVQTATVLQVLCSGHWYWQYVYRLCIVLQRLSLDSHTTAQAAADGCRSIPGVDLPVAWWC